MLFQRKHSIRALPSLLSLRSSVPRAAGDRQDRQARSRKGTCGAHLLHRCTQTDKMREESVLFRESQARCDLVSLCLSPQGLAACSLVLWVLPSPSLCLPLHISWHLSGSASTIPQKDIGGAHEIPIEWGWGLGVGFSHHYLGLAGLLLWEKFGFSLLPPHLTPTLFLTPSNCPRSNPVKGLANPPPGVGATWRWGGELLGVGFAGGRGEVTFHWVPTLLSLSVAGRGQGDDELHGHRSDLD